MQRRWYLSCLLLAYVARHQGDYYICEFILLRFWRMLLSYVESAL